MLPIDVDEAPNEYSPAPPQRSDSCTARIVLDEEILAPGLRAAIRREFSNEQDRVTTNPLEALQTSGSHTLYDTRQKTNFGDQRVRSELFAIARKLQDTDLRQHFLDVNITTRSLLEVLQHASSTDRVRFIKSLHRLAGGDSVLAEFARDKLDNVAFHTTPDERSEVIEYLLAQRNTRLANRHIATILRASSDLNQLSTVVNNVGINALLRTRDTTIREYVAQAYLGQQLRRIPFPHRLNEGTSFSDLERAIGQIKSGLQNVIRIGERSALADTLVARDFVRSAQDDLRNLEIDLQGYESHTNSIANLRQIVNVYSSIARLEATYGVNITRSSDSLFGRQEQRTRQLTPWTEEDIEQIERVLTNIPEGHLLFTPLLREIQRVPTLGEDVLGVRYNNGTIKIAEIAFNNESVSAAYGGENSFAIVLSHEIGHGIQIGSGSSDYDYRDPENPRFNRGEDIYDFDEYATLGGWEIIDRDFYEIINPSSWQDETMIRLNGNVLPLDRQVEYRGEQVVFKYDRRANTLIKYDANAEFSRRWYARTNPWEDFAEAFSEYTFLPERLIRDAPHKFLHLEQEFRRYANNERIQTLLQRELERRNRRSVQGPTQQPIPDRVAINDADLLGQNTMRAKE